MSIKQLASLSFALALVYSISLPARAELLKNFKTDGSIEVKSFGIDNETDRNGAADDYRGETRTRIMAGGSFDLLDDVHSRILLRKNNRLYGQTQDNVNSVETSLAVDNAYVKIDKVFKHIDVTMGRQFYGDPTDLLIYFGPNPDDLLTVNSLDIFRADADIMGWAKFQGIAGKIAENTATDATNPTYHAGTSAASGGNNSNADTDVWGAELSTDKLIPKGNLGIGYYTEQFKGAGATQNNTVNSALVKAMGDIPVVNGLGYSAELVQNFGRNNSAAGTPANHGSAYIVGLNWGGDASTSRGALPLRARAEYGRGSGDFTSISAGKRFGIIWGEQTSAGPSTLNGVGGAGITNLKVADAGAGFTCPITHIGVDFNWYRFMYDNGALVTTPAGNALKTSAGTEYDLILSYKHSENVYFEVNAATFQVGTALQNAAPTGTNPITRLGSDIKITF